MSVGDNIKKARKNAGLTQKELAEKCGAAEITIRQYESGKREPRNEQLMKIARLLNVELYDLLGYTVPEQNEHVQKARAQVLQDIMNEREQKTVSLETQITKSQETVLQYMELLNGNGQAEAVRMLKLLVKIPDYQKEKE